MQINNEIIAELNKKALLVQNILNTNGYFVDVITGGKIDTSKIKEVRLDTRVDGFYVIIKNGKSIDNKYEEKGYKLIIINQHIAATPVKILTINKFPIIKMDLIKASKPKSSISSNRPRSNRPMNNRRSNNKPRPKNNKPQQKKQ